MSGSGSRSFDVDSDAELRLPRPPGIIRRFWGKHPLATDILVAVICLLLSLVPAAALRPVGIPSPGVLVPAAVLAACVLLVWRRRWPVLILVAVYLVAALYTFTVVPVGGPLVFVACYSVAVYRSSRAAWIGYAIGSGSLLILTSMLAWWNIISFQVALNAFIGEGVIGLVGTLIGVNIGNRRRYIDAVIARSRQLLLERDQRAQLAAAGERARIAREMHDIVSHSLTVIVALSEGAAATRDPDRARAATETAAATARDALTEMRSMLGVLRTEDAEAPLAPGVPIAPADTVASAQRAGFPVSLSVTGEATPPQPVQFAVGRIVQEGVTNAMRHAPGATFIRVAVDSTADSLRVVIRNDGAARARGDEGFGLRGIAERVAHVGGTFHSGPEETGRWLLRAEIPIGPAPKEDARA